MLILDLIFLAVLVPGVPVEEQVEIPTVIDPLAEIALLEEVEEFVRLTTKQELLQDLDWYRGQVDGIRGPLTEEAVEDFADAADLDSLDPDVIILAARAEDAPTRPPPPAPEPDPVPQAPSPSPGSGSESGIAAHWLALADCESGEWDRNANPIPGSRRWTYGITFVRPAYAQFQGGLNFHPGTWQSFKDPGMPDHAGNATPHQQVTVGKRVQAAQGWGAWPVCSRKVGLR